MSRIMELVEEYGRRRYESYKWLHYSKDAKAADAILAEIRAAVQELERDADRYRWLRERREEYSDSRPFIAQWGVSVTAWSGWAADGAVDEAMAEDK